MIRKNQLLKTVHKNKLSRKETSEMRYLRLHTYHFFSFISFENIFVMRCAIWHQTLKNGVRMVGQNPVLTSYNALEQLSQESVSLNPLAWHSNSYLTFSHSCGMYMTLECNANGISGKKSNCFIRKVL